MDISRELISAVNYETFFVLLPIGIMKAFLLSALYGSYLEVGWSLTGVWKVCMAGVAELLGLNSMA